MISMKKKIVTGLCATAVALGTVTGAPTAMAETTTNYAQSYNVSNDSRSTAGDTLRWLNEDSNSYRNNKVLASETPSIWFLLRNTWKHSFLRKITSGISSVFSSIFSWF